MKIETAVVARDNKNNTVYASAEDIIALRTEDFLYYFSKSYVIRFDLNETYLIRIWEIEDLRFDVPIGSFIDDLKARSILDENEIVTNAYTEEQFCFKLCMDD